MPAPAEDGILVRTFALTFATGRIFYPYVHDWDQLIYASQGVMTIHTPKGSWVVPPHRAVWVPAGTDHRVTIAGVVSMRTLCLVAGLAKELPRDCCVVNVRPLLRELILHTVRLGMLRRTVPAQARLIGVILDQLEALPAIPLQLPMPRDGRALKVAELLSRNPGDAGSLEEISKLAGASPRTIERVFRAETNMAFGKWRQRLRLLHALRLLAAGEPVTSVALDTGYDSTSAFISMFKRELGTTPKRYHAFG